jgi:ferric hydroxamate transport system permease protein
VTRAPSTGPEADPAAAESAPPVSSPPSTSGVEPSELAPVRRLQMASAVAGGLVVIAVLAAVHLTQGTSGIGLGDLLGLVTERDQNVWNILVGSRIPRLVAAVLVGMALGVAGAGMQSLARNPLASPDTLGVNAGSHVAVTALAAFGLSFGLLPSGVVAFIGGLLAAGFVVALGAGGSSGPTRLILAGAATAMALKSLTMVLLLLFEEETRSLYAWGEGSLVQVDLEASRQMLPVIVVGIAALMIMGHRLDVLGLGDDAATSLGLHVGRTRVLLTLFTVLLAAASVTIAGPIGFVGLCAPVIVRLLAPVVPGIMRHRVLLPLSGLMGVAILVGSDVLLRATLGAQSGVEVPTGAVTTILGAGVLIWLARRFRDSGPARRPPAAHSNASRTLRRFWTVVGVIVVALVGAVIAALLLGDTVLLLGDVMNRLNGVARINIVYVLDERTPRLLAALLAGAALALAGTTVQAVCRNPLAEPGILGITAGAGLGAIFMITLVPAAAVWMVSGAGAVGALTTFALVYGLSWRGGLSSDRLVLIGIGFQAGLAALTVVVIISSDPWNLAKALTWLSGSTYNRTLPQLVPVIIALLVITPFVVAYRRELDVLSLDDDTPRVLGVRLERTRMVALVAAALLTATAVSAIGVVGFVGLVAPHAARGLVGSRHSRVIPVAALLGALMVSVADTIGRTVIAPAQIPAGLLVAMIGAPYFVWLLWRSRA